MILQNQDTNLIIIDVENIAASFLFHDTLLNRKMKRAVVNFWNNASYFFQVTIIHNFKNDNKT